MPLRDSLVLKYRWDRQFLFKTRGFNLTPEETRPRASVYSRTRQVVSICLV